MRICLYVYQPPSNLMLWIVDSPIQKKNDLLLHFSHFFNGDSYRFYQIFFQALALYPFHHHPSGTNFARLLQAPGAMVLECPVSCARRNKPRAEELISPPPMAYPTKLKRGTERRVSIICLRKLPGDFAPHLQPPVYERKFPSIFVFWGTWGMFEGFCWNFLRHVKCLEGLLNLVLS